jgi:hypothetical protein
MPAAARKSRAIEQRKITRRLPRDLMAEDWAPAMVDQKRGAEEMFRATEF